MFLLLPRLLQLLVLPVLLALLWIAEQPLLACLQHHCFRSDDQACLQFALVVLQSCCSG